ncbi:unnamed protein product [Paramecium sonneborni]|uniref:Uncharacterized protein n=1 Tax=Paramecium sonneborni TaxID=65129 RepID=A0A8S1RFY1_9CILI|nr:unnamed protein product [Paramecium sonneborni]
MQQYLKPTMSLYLQLQKDEIKLNTNIQDIKLDPANFLNNFDALPDQNLRFKSKSMFLQSKQTDQKKEMQKTKHTKFLVLPKIDSKFMLDPANERVYFLPETKQKYEYTNRLINSNIILQPLFDGPSKSSKDHNQLQAKKKKVKFNIALEIVDLEGRVSTEIINPEQKIITRQKRFSRLKTLEC